MSKEIPCPKCGHVWLWVDWKKEEDAVCPKGHGCARHQEEKMSDDLVKRLRETTHMYQADCELKMKCADRIEELEERLKAAQDDAKEAEAYVEELEAKLEKAVEALRGLVPILCEGVEDGCGKLSRHDCAACEGYATIAELKGQDDE
jgi:uncharacterized coiled-coil protein SlyX